MENRKQMRIAALIWRRLNQKEYRSRKEALTRAIFFRDLSNIQLKADWEDFRKLLKT